MHLPEGEPEYCGGGNCADACLARSLALCASMYISCIFVVTLLFFFHNKVYVFRFDTVYLCLCVYVRVCASLWSLCAYVSMYPRYASLCLCAYASMRLWICAFERLSRIPQFAVSDVISTLAEVACESRVFIEN